MIAFLSICVCIFILLPLTKFLHKVWWTPITVQHIMALQGIKGPSYKFLYGNTKEMINMREKALGSPMDLSHHILPRILPHIHAWGQIYGKIFIYWRGPQAQLVVTEPELIREILNNNNGAFGKVIIDGYGKKLVGDGILVSEGEKWTKLRKISNQAFHGESLKEMVPSMVASIETMLERWRHREKMEIDVYKEYRLLTSEVISRTAFGSSYLEGKNIFDMLRQLGEIIARNALKVRFPAIGKVIKSQDDIESDKIEQRIRDIITAMIEKREKKVMTGEADTYGSDYLGLLIKASHDVGGSNRISIDTVISECKVFYIAGQDTTNGLLAWTTFLLAIHTDWQDKAREEVLHTFGHLNPNPEGIARLKTISTILQETLRLYGPLTNLLRRVVKEVKLGNFIVPANIDVSIPSLALHHDPETWGKDTHLFRPERFAQGVTKATNNNSTAFIPFGYGPRMCVGLNLATTEAKVALSMILQRYRFTLSPSYVHSPLQVLTVRPQHGIQVIVQPL